MRYFSIYMLALALGSTLACGGGGGSSKPVPVISNLQVAPASMLQGPAGGTNNVAFSFSFQDAAGGLSTLRMSGFSSGTTPIQNVQGLTTGVISGYITVSTTTVGTYEGSLEVIDANGETSNDLTFTLYVTPPPPYLTHLSPTMAVVGDPAKTLTVNGSGFTSAATVLWNGNPRVTTFVSGSVVTAQLTAHDLATAGTVQITVENVGPTGTSTSLPFTVSSIRTAMSALPTNDIAWDPVHGALYASIPTSAGNLGSSIAKVDPSNAAILSTVATSSEPGVMAVSPDGQYLYAALNGANAIQRFLLPSLTPDVVITLDPALFQATTAYTVVDLQPAPGGGGTFAVSLDWGLNSPVHNGIVVFDQTDALGTYRMPAWGSVLGLQWGQDATQLMAENMTNVGDLLLLSIGQAGPALTSDTPFVFTIGGAIHWVPTLRMLVTDTGQAVNPSTAQTAGTYPLSHGINGGHYAWFTAQAAQNKAFFLIWDPVSQGCFLQSFGLASFAAINTVAINGYGDAYMGISGSPMRLLDCGSAGLIAGGHGEQICIMTGPFLGEN